MRAGHKAEQLLQQREMSLDAQKQLAKGYEARNMQYGGRHKVVQLEAVKLQEPAKEWVDWKPDAS